MSAAAVDTTTYTSWTEVKPKSGGEWQRYDLLVPDSECSGEITFYDWFDTPLAFATEQLRYYLPIVAGDVDEDEDLPELLVRVRVWAEEDASGDPLALVQATSDEMEKARLANACRAISTAEWHVKEARNRLHRQILRSRTAGLDPRALAHAVRERVDPEDLDRILDAHSLTRRVQAALGEQRAYAYVADFDEGTVQVGLHLRPAEEGVFAEMLMLGPDCLEVESPETLRKAEAFHAAALRDAQTLLDTLADRFEVRTREGRPACATDLVPEPLAYCEVLVHDRYADELHRPRLVSSPKGRGRPMA